MAAATAAVARAVDAGGPGSAGRKGGDVDKLIGRVQLVGAGAGALLCLLLLWAAGPYGWCLMTRARG